MDPILTLGLVTLGSFFKDCLKSVAVKHTVGGAEAASQQSIKIVKETLSRASLPKNHDLLHSLEDSFGQAASAFACAVAYQVEQKPTWIEAIRAHYQRGTLGKVPLLEMRDSPERDWVAELLKQAGGGPGTRPVSADFLLDEQLVSELLLQDADAELKRRVNNAFSAWLERRVQHGRPPACVAGLLEQGWPLEPGQAQRVTFYQAFCAFFAEKIKDDSKVERIFLAQTVSQLAREFKELKSLKPAATLAEFRGWLEGPLAEILAGLRAIQVQVVATHGVVVANRETLARIETEQQHQTKLIKELEQLVREQNQQPRPAADSGPPLDFPLAIRQLAKQHGMTPRAVEREVAAWVRETRATSPDLAQRARAEFLAQHFTEAARLHEQAAAEKLARHATLRADQRELAREAARELMRAGEARRAASDHQGALTQFMQAARLLSRAQDPEQWAELQVWLGLAHWDLGIRVAGPAARKHLLAAITAYQRALGVYTRKELPQQWAATQNNLGNVLSDLAGRTEGEQAVAHLEAARAAYAAALGVYTRKELPQDWAMTQNNLGTVLRDLAGRTEGEQAVAHLAQAIQAYRAALEVFTRRDFPYQHGVVSRNLVAAEQDRDNR